MINQSKPNFERIMIIDDNQIDLYIFSKLIAKNNFSENILVYNSPEKALHFIKQNQENPLLIPQIIFLDIYMPQMNGFEFLENYKALNAITTQNCKIIMVSSSIDHNDIYRAKTDNSVALFAVKPITKKLFDAVATL
jgi:CheY-like chemotaxis protein